MNDQAVPCLSVGRDVCAAVARIIAHRAAVQLCASVVHTDDSA